MLELLSPAGSMEALRAAVQNGANAVYLGYDMFNARMGAQNFSADELQEAIVYCHVRGVQVHLTLNTLVSDREMARAAEVIRAAAVFGVDAFIVQDLGMVQLCKEIAPSVPIHASTQMSIHSLEGVVAAAELGCSRVVLARELPMEQIRHICRRSPVEIEVFGPRRALHVLLRAVLFIKRHRADAPETAASAPSRAGFRMATAGSKRRAIP